MRILFVTPHPPSRIRVRSFGFLSHLRRDHEVTILTPVASEQEQKDIAALRSQGYTVVAVPEASSKRVLRSGMALLSPVPLQVAYARSRHFGQEIRRLCSEQTFDVVHIEHIRGIASLRDFSSLPPVVWDAVDCISLLFQQTMKGGSSLPVRSIAFVEHGRTRRFEGKLLTRLGYSAVTSERDRKALLELYRRYQKKPVQGEPEVSVIPNGVDLEYFQPAQEECRSANLVFLGKMSYHANIAAVLYLHQQIMPLIWQERPDATLTIVGSNPPPEIRRLSTDARVEVTGYVDDVRSYVRQATVMLCPMVYSVGIQNKVLESLALGTPVVAAAQVAAALDAVPDQDLLVARSPQDFADAALRVFSEPELRHSLSIRGRRYVELRHSWSAVAERLAELYQQAVEQRKGASLHGVSVPS